MKKDKEKVFKEIEKLFEEDYKTIVNLQKFILTSVDVVGVEKEVMRNMYVEMLKRRQEKFDEIKRKLGI